MSNEQFEQLKACLKNISALTEEAKEYLEKKDYERLLDLGEDIECEAFSFNALVIKLGRSD